MNKIKYIYWHVFNFFNLFVYLYFKTKLYLICLFIYELIL